jgi:hypothetical protein
MADSSGLTSPAKRGAHNGWRARPDQDWVGVNVGSDDSICRRDNGGQPGTLFDVYSSVAGESNIPAGRPGSRGANKNTAGGSLTAGAIGSGGKWATHGPNQAMSTTYQIMVLLASDIGTEALGPLPDQTDDDIGLFTNYLILPGGHAPPPRGFIATGQKLGENLSIYHSTFMSTQLRATLRNENYLLLTGDHDLVTDLVVQTPVSSSSTPYGLAVSNQCFLNNDVFNVVPGGTVPAQAGGYYHNVAGGYVASVYGPNYATRPYKTLYNGWTMGLFGGMGARPAYASTVGGLQSNLLNVGLRKYFYEALTSAFGDLACTPTGLPVGVGDGTGKGSSFVNFMNLKSSNPMKSGEARIAFGLAKADRVQIRIYDVTGRLMKTVADRYFPAGTEHVVIWDGTNSAGDKVKAGVYFYQLKAASWTSQKKLAVLAN